MDPHLAHESRVVAVFVSRKDPQEQGVLAWTARWDGSALWLDPSGASEPVLILKPGIQALLVKVTPDVLVTFKEGTEYGAELGPLVDDAEFVSFSEVAQMPVGAASIPRAFAHAFVPNWKTR
jgi:hypothetical protein